MPEQDIQTPPVKVTFSSEQQSKVDELIRESMGRAASTVKAELHTTQTRLTTLLAESEVLRAENATLKEGRAGLETTLTAKDKEAKSSRDESVSVKKKNAIQEATEKNKFEHSAKSPNIF